MPTRNCPRSDGHSEHSWIKQGDPPRSYWCPGVYKVSKVILDITPKTIIKTTPEATAKAIEVLVKLLDSNREDVRLIAAQTLLYHVDK